MNIIKDQRPGGVIISPGCRLACLFCGGHRKTPISEIKNQEIKIYKNLQYFKKNGVERISISGSDPIEYDNLIELVEYIKKEGFQEIDLSTHGEKFSDKSFTKKLITAGINKLRIPIYGSRAEIHDSITRTPGSFKKVVLGIKNLIENHPEVKIQISTLIFRENKDDLLNIVDFLNKLKIKDNYFSIPCLTEESSSFYIPFKELGPLVKKLYKYALKINSQTRFREIPFCIFGELNTVNIENMGLPPNLGKYNQPPDIVKTEIPDLPSYRLKKKVAMCKLCKASDYCHGFFVNDINKFGTGKIQPIKK
jgi:MoaA/NifB/PqqE/SkfB family radical SAM enzyme